VNRKPTRLRDDNPPSSPGVTFDTRSRGEDPGRDESGALLAAIAHRLSQPLTALRGTLELARLKATSVAEYRSAVEKALESAERLAWLVQCLRELADAGVPAGERVPTILDEVADSVLEDLRPLAASRGVHVATRIERGLLARTYPERLSQALLKVLYHSILRSPEGKTVRMELHSSPDNAQWVIADEGAPYSFADAEHFIRTPFAGQDLPGGSGESVLGLVTAKQFMEALGGSLSVESRGDRGSRVLIHLPTVSRETP
jgi:signal transduction histidine kinase